MSGIQFHTRHEHPLSVHGTERAHAASVAVETVISVLGADAPGGMWALLQRGVLPRGSLIVLGGQDPRDALRLWLSDPLGMSEVTISGERSPVIAAVLNTAAVAGPDPVAFLARLHGSVENRLWVAAEDAAWLAGVIREGCTSGVLGEGMGWEDVAERLATTDSPVVISSSQGIDFPTAEYDEEADEIITPEDPDAAWTASLAEVMAQGWWQQLTPDNLRNPAYAPLTTFQDALAEKDPTLPTPPRA